MQPDSRGDRLRRYVLGTATEAECADIEGAYFASAGRLDQVRAAEDDLIDDYLSGRLAADERDRFERHYLATPSHRTRVAVVARLRAGAARRPEERRARIWSFAPLVAIRAWSPAVQFAAAAALIIVVAAIAWSLTRTLTPSTAIVSTPPATGAATPPAAPAASPPRREPVVVAITLAPILVRAAGQPARVTIAPGTDSVRLQLQGETGGPRRRGERVVVRTVAGEEIWRGPAIAPTQSGADAIAIADVPVANLEAGDYIVTLLGTDGRGRDAEQYRYFFRVSRPD